VGAIDRKPVHIRCPQTSGSQFYNYKSDFSVHLQAIVDAKYKFMTVDIRAYGRQSDCGAFTGSNVFRHCEIRKRWQMTQDPGIKTELKGVTQEL
jgi:hypothetical protein